MRHKVSCGLSRLLPMPVSSQLALRYVQINTLVKVPVLSEHNTVMALRVSTVFKDLHRILFFLIIFAVIVKLAVRAIGSPSEMKAMATLTQSTINVGTLIQSGWSLRNQEALSQIQ